MKTINGIMYRSMVASGYMDLMRNVEEVNRLNVFPVPDGDTGSNMLSTIAGGLEATSEENVPSIGRMSSLMSHGMLLGARGNSGVILSRFFAGLSEGLRDKEEAGVKEFAKAMDLGVQTAYKAVMHPTEGTILTVMREGTSYAESKIEEDSSFEDYFTDLASSMRESLKKTPDLLPILKEAGVIDSGGAGLIYIVEGMGQAIGGRLIEDVSLHLSAPTAAHYNPQSFNADSPLDYGYCTEFLLQLSNAKKGPESFKLQDLIDYFSTFGNSLVAFQEGTIVKVHVHTKTPALAIVYAQKYGEFIAFKMENMALQHHETLIEQSKHIAFMSKPVTKERDLACVIAVPDEETGKIFQNYGNPVLVISGDSINPSAEDFLKAYQSAQAKELIVLPNNKNAVMAATQAAEFFGKSKVNVLPTANLAEGYSAYTAMDESSSGAKENLVMMKEALKNASIASFARASRDAEIQGVHVKEGDCLLFIGGALAASKGDMPSAVQEFFSRVEHLEDKGVCTLFFGKEIGEKEQEELKSLIMKIDGEVELVCFKTNRTLYDLIIDVE